MFLDAMFFGAPTISLPSLKSNSSPLENGWLEYFLVSFLGGIAYFHGAFPVSFKEFVYQVWCLEAEWERCASIIFLPKKTMEEFIVAMALLQRRREAGVRLEGGRYQGLSWRGFRGPAGFVIVRIRLGIVGL